MSSFTESLSMGASALGLTLNQVEIRAFETYKDILLEWNQKINLTAIKEEKDIAIKHFIDSMVLTKYIESGSLRLLDLGTGAGFPGLPLKITSPRLDVTLMDSLQKRIGFLNQVIEVLQLKQIKAIHGRAEDLAQQKEFREKFDLVTARAVARLNVLSEYCLPFVKKGGRFIALKGPEGEIEIQEAEKAISILGGKLIKTEVLDLPLDGGSRSIIIIEKIKDTPVNYPRKAGTPEKKPL